MNNLNIKNYKAILTFMIFLIGLFIFHNFVKKEKIDEKENFILNDSIKNFEIFKIDEKEKVNLGPGNTYYVDVNGNDENDGLSENSPWKTIEKINKQSFRPGDNILFKRGNTWKGKMEIHSSGSENLPILFGAYGNGSKPTILAPENDAAVVLIAADYVVLQDLDVRGGYSSVAIYGSDYTIIEDCDIGRDSFIGIWVNQKEWEPKKNHSNHGIIRRCIIDQGHNTEKHPEDGIHLRDGVNYWKIYDNEIKDWGHSGISLFQQDNNTTVSYNKIYRNLITGKKSDYMRGFEIKAKEGGAQYNEFYFNIIRDTNVRNQIAGDHNLIYYNIFDTVKSSTYQNITTEAGAININGGWTENEVGHDNKIFNNVIYNCDEAGIEVRSHEISPSIYNIEIINNIIMECGKNSKINLNNIALWMKNESKITNITIKNNIIYNPGITNIINYKGIIMSVEDFNKLDVDDNIIRNNIQLDPRFVDPKNHNFHLKSNSPGIDAGINVKMDKDFDGIPLPQGNNVDIGVFEFH